jgi:hypothetical protein
MATPTTNTVEAAITLTSHGFAKRVGAGGIN